jgi:hypothetical protein
MWHGLMGRVTALRVQEATDSFTLLRVTLCARARIRPVRRAMQRQFDGTFFRRSVGIGLLDEG